MSNNKDLTIQAGQRWSRTKTNVARNGQLPRGLKLVTNVLLTYLNRNSLYEIAWASNSRLANEAGVSTSVAERAVRALRQIGAIETRTLGAVDLCRYCLEQYDFKPKVQQAQHRLKLVTIQWEHALWNRQQLDDKDQSTIVSIMSGKRSPQNSSKAANPVASDGIDNSSNTLARDGVEHRRPRRTSKKVFQTSDDVCSTVLSESKLSSISPDAEPLKEFHSSSPPALPTQDGVSRPLTPSATSANSLGRKGKASVRTPNTSVTSESVGRKGEALSKSPQPPRTPETSKKVLASTEATKGSPLPSFKSSDESAASRACEVEGQRKVSEKLGEEIRNSSVVSALTTSATSAAVASGAATPNAADVATEANGSAGDVSQSESSLPVVYRFGDLSNQVLTHLLHHLETELGMQRSLKTSGTLADEFRCLKLPADFEFQESDLIAALKVSRHLKQFCWAVILAPGSPPARQFCQELQDRATSRIEQAAKDAYNHCPEVRFKTGISSRVEFRIWDVDRLTEEGSEAVNTCQHIALLALIRCPHHHQQIRSLGACSYVVDRLEDILTDSEQSSLFKEWLKSCQGGAVVDDTATAVLIDRLSEIDKRRQRKEQERAEKKAAEKKSADRESNGFILRMRERQAAAAGCTAEELDQRFLEKMKGLLASHGAGQFSK